MMNKTQLNMVQVARTVPLFRALAPLDWENVAQFLSGICYPKEEYVFHEGDQAEALFIVWMGQVKLVRHSGQGRDVMLDMAGPGHIIGELAVIEGKPYDVSAQCMDEVAVIMIAHEDFFRLIDRYPKLSMAVALELAQRLRNTTELVRSLAIERVEQRIAKALLRLASAVGCVSPGGVQLNIALTRQDLADMTGTTVESAIRVMSKLRREGIIINKEGRVVVLDIDGLQQLTE